MASWPRCGRFPLRVSSLPRGTTVAVSEIVSPSSVSVTIDSRSESFESLSGGRCGRVLPSAVRNAGSVPRSSAIRTSSSAIRTSYVLRFDEY